MGNSLSERIFLKNKSLVKSIWVEELMISQALITSEGDPILKELMEKADLKIMQLAYGEAKESQISHQSKVEATISGLRSMLAPEIMREVPEVSIHNTIRNFLPNNSYRLVERHRLAMCQILFSWIENYKSNIRIGLMVTTEEHLKTAISEILKLLELPENSNGKDKLLSLTLSYFIQDFMVGIRSDEEQTRSKQLSRLHQFINSGVFEEDLLNKSEKISVEIRQILEDITMNLLQILKKRSNNLDEYNKQEIKLIFECAISLCHILGSIKIYLLVLSVISDFSESIKSLDIEIPKFEQSITNISELSRREIRRIKLIGCDLKERGTAKLIQTNLNLYITNENNGFQFPNNLNAYELTKIKSINVYRKEYFSSFGNLYSMEYNDDIYEINESSLSSNYVDTNQLSYCSGFVNPCQDSLLAPIINCNYDIQVRYKYLHPTQKGIGFVFKMILINDDDLKKKGYPKYLMTISYVKRMPNDPILQPYRDKVIRRDGVIVEFPDFNNLNNDAYRIHISPSGIAQISCKNEVWGVHLEEAEVIWKFEAQGFAGFNVEQKELYRIEFGDEDGVLVIEEANSNVFISFAESVLKKMRLDNSGSRIKKILKRNRGIVDSGFRIDNEKSIIDSILDRLEVPEESPHKETIDINGYALRLIGFLTKSFFTNVSKPEFKELFQDKSIDMLSFIRRKNLIENSYETYQIMNHMISRLETPQTDFDYSLICYLIVSFEQHLKYLSEIQGENSTKSIVSIDMLQLILAKIRLSESNMSKERLGLVSKGMSDAIANVEELIEKIQGRLPSKGLLIKSYNKYINGKTGCGYSSALNFLRLLKLENFKMIINDKPDDHQEQVNQVKVLFFELCKKLLEGELKSFEKIKSKVAPTLSDFQGSPSHIKWLFSALLLWEREENQYSDILEIGKIALNNFKYLVSSEGYLREFFSSVNDDDSDLVTSIDKYFTTSLTGIIIASFYGLNEFSDTAVFDVEISSYLSDISYSLIETINLFGKYSEKYLPKKMLNSTIAKVSGSDKYTHIKLEEGQVYSAQIPTGMLPQNVCVCLFRREETKPYSSRSLVTSGAEFIGSWEFESKNKVINGLRDGTYFVVTSRSKDDPTVEIEFISSHSDWSSSLSLLNLSKIALGYIGKTSKELSVDQTPCPIEEKLAQSYDNVLGSNLFENGLSKELYENSVLSEKDLLQNNDITLLYEGYLKMIYEQLKIDDESRARFEELVNSLQNEISYNLFKNLGGVLGLIAVKSVFLILCYHQGCLADMLSRTIPEKISSCTKEYSPDWNTCTEIRKKIKGFSTERESISFYQKLLILTTIEPSESWLLIDRRLGSVSSSSKLGDLPQLTKASSTQVVKEYVSKLTSRKNDNRNDKNLLSLIIKFSTLEGSASDLLSYIEWKRERFITKHRSMKLVLSLMNNSQESPLLNEISAIFEKLFRPVANQLTYITDNYNGLPWKMVNTKIASIKQILKIFVDFICSPSKTLDLKMQAMNSLKWLFRGREHECVITIDIERIWNSCKPHFAEKGFLSSLLELMEVLMNFCVRKITELDSEDSVSFAH